MVKSRIEQLQAADTHLTRSFIGLVAAGAIFAFITVFIGLRRLGTAGQLVVLLLALVQLACYVWYAISAGTAARLVGGKRWHFLTWILVAPLISWLPLIGTFVGISPLCIKFLLGGQLQAAIRDEMHHMMREPADEAPGAAI